MRCERCQKYDATIHLTEIIKDMRSEVHICESCAREIGLNSKISNFSVSVSEMLSFLDYTKVREYAESESCQRCGTSFADFRASGRVGCSECYVTLSSSLAPVIASYHDGLKHVGKVPGNSTKNLFREPLPPRDQTIRNEDGLHDLEMQLMTAVSEERYEDAAVLRDRINAFVKR
jgi:protein arginine kinase activator